MLGDLCGYVIVGLTLGKLGQIGAAVLVLRLILQGRTEDTLDLAPSFGEDMLAFCREGMTAALKANDNIPTGTKCARPQAKRKYPLFRSPSWE